MNRHTLIALGAAAIVSSACAPSSTEPAAEVAAGSPTKAALGIRPNGDTEISPDMSQVHSEDLKKIYAYIDEHTDEHVENLQR